MRNINTTELIAEKELLEEMRAKYGTELRKLAEYESYYLKRRNIRGAVRYYKVERGSGQEQYLRDDEQRTIHDIQRCVYYTEAVKAIDRNIKSIETFLRHYEEFFPERIIDQLSDCYKDVRNVVANGWSQSAEEWLEEMNAAKRSVESFRPEELVHVAIDGTKVRSKGELQIYNMLLFMGIPFVYEPVIETSLGKIVPDFAIYDERNGRTLYWEHLGMMYDRDYFNKQFIKLQKYASINYTPLVNLIITMDDANGHFDTTVVAKMLKIYLGMDADLSQIS